MVLVLDTNPIEWARRPASAGVGGGAGGAGGGGGAGAALSASARYGSGGGGGGGGGAEDGLVTLETTLDHLWVFLSAYFMLHHQVRRVELKGSSSVLTLGNFLICAPLRISWR